MNNYEKAMKKIAAAQKYKQIGCCNMPAITLTIGEVTTGAPGSDAEASITGVSPNFVLNLTIPQGPAGTA